MIRFKYCTSISSKLNSWPETPMYSCHGVFTDQFLFRTIFALIRISFILTFIIINTFSFPFAKICRPEINMFFHGYHQNRVTVCMLFELTTMVFVDSHGIELTGVTTSETWHKFCSNLVYFKESSFVCETADRQIFRWWIFPHQKMR